MKRPAVVSAAAVFPLLLILNCTEAKVAGIACACFAVLFILSAVLKQKMAMYVLGFMIAASFSAGLFMHFGPDHDRQFDGMIVNINATVERRYNNGTYLLEINNANSSVYNIDINGRILLNDYLGGDYREKDIISGKVRLSEPQTDILGLWRTDYANGVYLKAYNEEPLLITGREETSFFDISYNLRNYIRNVCRKIGGEEGGLVLSLLTGDKIDLSDETLEEFRRCGLSHIMAVSGMHLSVVTGIVITFMDKIECSRRLRQFICIGFMLFVMTAASFSYSVLRAGIMSAIVIFSFDIGRKSKPINSLGAAVTVISILSPFAVTDIGFLLSVSATFGILTVMPVLYRMLFRIRIGFLRWVAISIAVSFSATVGILPIASVIFSSVSFMGVVLCLATNIFVSLLIVLGLVLCVVWFVPGVSEVLCYIAFWSSRIFMNIVERLSLYDYAVIEFEPVPLIVLGILLVVFCIIKAAKGFSEVRRNIFLLCGLLAFTVSFFCSARLFISHAELLIGGEDKSIYAFAHKENAFIVLECTDISRAKQVKAYMSAEDLSFINAFVLQDYSEGRLEALEYLLKFNIIEKIIAPDIVHSQKYGIIELVKESKAQLILTEGGSSFDFNSLSVSLYPYSNGGIVPYFYYNGFGCVLLSEDKSPSEALLPQADMLICSEAGINGPKGIESISPEIIAVYDCPKAALSGFKALAGKERRSISAVDGNMSIGINNSGRYTLTFNSD